MSGRSNKDFFPVNLIKPYSSGCLVLCFIPFCIHKSVRLVCLAWTVKRSALQMSMADFVNNHVYVLHVLMSEDAVMVVSFSIYYIYDNNDKSMWQTTCISHAFSQNKTIYWLGVYIKIMITLTGDNLAFQIRKDDINVKMKLLTQKMFLILHVFLHFVLFSLTGNLSSFRYNGSSRNLQARYFQIMSTGSFTFCVLCFLLF